MEKYNGKPATFYEVQLASFKVELKEIKKKGLLLSLMRLLIFVGVVVSLTYSNGSNAIIATSLLIGISIFLFLVSKSQDTRYKKKTIQAHIKINEDELAGLKGDNSIFSNGKEYSFGDHFYNQDIDLFGDGSIYQLINRAELRSSQEYLASVLNSNDVDNIESKQDSIQELTSKAEWRQKFKVNASLIETDFKAEQVVKWISNYQPSIPKVFKYITLIFGAISITGFILFGFSIINWPLLLIWFFVGFGITGVYFKKVNYLYNSIGKLKDVFVQYSTLLNLIENQKFESERLKEQQENIKTEGLKASQIFNNLSKELNSLDQRNNFIFSPIAQGFFLWDIKYTLKIENWINNFEETIENWFKAVEFIETYNSFANYAFNHPSNIYPEINENSSCQIEGVGLGHPLLNVDARVDNDFSIDKEGFLIITGANMAGKSTFLRTLALKIVMSNVGLPVVAKKLKYSPIKLISSMRTSDSLQNDESYFFSELKRLKLIVDEIQKDSYFIVLDEILKGTNSKDKEEGSKKFVQKLVKSNSTGIIATHDLSLCELSKEFDEIKNFYFDAEILNDELHFDYTFKKGICQNMNASFLLRKMEIVDE